VLIEVPSGKVLSVQESLKSRKEEPVERIVQALGHANFFVTAGILGFDYSEKDQSLPRGRLVLRSLQSGKIVDEVLTSHTIAGVVSNRSGDLIATYGRDSVGGVDCSVVTLWGVQYDPP
jgi:hypothetical protein